MWCGEFAGRLEKYFFTVPDIQTPENWHSRNISESLLAAARQFHTKLLLGQLTAAVLII